jgi:chromosome segregation ATPase
VHANLRRPIFIATLALLVSASAWAQDQSSQSGDAVADAARKAAQQKKDSPKPKKVYTDDDISTRKSDISVVGQAPAPSADNKDQAKSVDATSKSADGKDATEKKEDPNSESAWRARFGKLREKINATQDELDVLQREESKGSTQYFNDPTQALKEQYSRDEINQRAAKIDAKKKALAALKQQWSDLEDQLRAAHGDPGWAR